MGKAQLEELEQGVNAELYRMAKDENAIHDPITDGVIDIGRYLSASPKMLWILKEPWEKPDEGDRGGDWSLTKGLIPELIEKDQVSGNPAYRKMAYVSFSVLNGFPAYSDIPYTHDDPRVADSLRSIAYINVKKSPGGTISNSSEIETHYQRNRAILEKQVEVINPDVVIAGNILHMFYDQFRIKPSDLSSSGSAEFCRHGRRLYINAYHPSYWGLKEQRYVDDLVGIIRRQCPALRKNSATV